MPLLACSPLLSPLLSAEGGGAATPADAATPAAHATLGGGCFWCLEALYAQMPGVLEVTSGYAGGKQVNPTYEQVCSGTTGHAEVVRLRYDPSVVSYEDLLAFFWRAHNPTTLNRQGADVGTQYRSIILFEDDRQKALAEASVKAAQPNFSQPIVTELAALDVFYPAEIHHQDYYARNPNASYCRYVIAPKLEALKPER